MGKFWVRHCLTSAAQVHQQKKGENAHHTYVRRPALTVFGSWQLGSIQKRVELLHVNTESHSTVASKVIFSCLSLNRVTAGP